MTTFKIIVDDERADQLKKILNDVSFVKIIEEEHHPLIENQLAEPGTSYERIKKILDSAKGKNLFKEIEDPSEWQRQIRKEWDRDF